MLARFIDAEGRERWVNVKVEDMVEVREGKRKVMFIYEIRGVKVEETANVSRLPEVLSLVKLELDGLLDRKGGRVSLAAAKYGISRALDISFEEALDLIRALKEITGEYVITGDEISRV